MRTNERTIGMPPGDHCEDHRDATGDHWENYREITKKITKKSPRYHREITEERTVHAPTVDTYRAR